MTLTVPMLLRQRRCLCLLSMLILASCGGSGTGTGTGTSGNEGSSPATSSTPPEGTLLQSPGQLISTVTAPSLLVELNLPRHPLP
jgi:hypothetical protein